MSDFMRPARMDSATTDQLDISPGTLTAANATLTGLGTPGAITVTPVLSQLMSITTVAAGQRATGLLTAVDTATYSTGVATCVAKASLIDGETLTVTDASGAVIYEFDVAGDGVTAPNVAVDVSLCTDAASVAAVLAPLIDAGNTDVAVVDNLDGTITLTAGTIGAAGDLSFADTVADAGFTAVPTASVPKYVDGETFTLDDGTHAAVVFELDVAGDGVTPGNTVVDISAATDAASVGAAITAAITGVLGATFTITAADNLDGTVSLRNSVYGASGNAASAETVADAGFVLTNMAGGVDGVLDGDFFTVDDGTTSVIFEFDTDTAVTAGNTAVTITGTETADNIRDLLVIALPAAGLDVQAIAGGAATVSIRHDTPGAIGGANSENVVDAGFAVSAWADPVATTWTYKLVARLADGTTTEAGAASSTAGGAPDLNGRDYNVLTWSAVTNAFAYDVYRTVCGTTPATTGKINADPLLALTLTDDGLVGDTAAAPTVDGTGRVTADGFTMATGAGAGKVLTSDANGVGSWSAPGAAGAAGADTQVQFNDGGAVLGGATAVTYQKASGSLGVTGPFTAGPPSTDITILTARASAAPGTAAIAQFQASDNTVLSSINHDGKYTLLADKGVGKVLTSDANGVGSWAAASGGGITNSAGANVIPKSDGTNLVATGLTEASAGAVATTAGTALGLTATAPAATTGASQAGIPVTITASPAVASTDTAGAAAGGSVTITAGAAAMLTSGNANGGDIFALPGAPLGTGLAGGLRLRSDGLRISAPDAFTIDFRYSNTIAGRFSQNGAGSGITAFQAEAFTLGATATSPDVYLRRRGAANPAWGAATATTGPAYTHTMAGVGTGTNATGGTATITSAPGTGTGAVSRLLLGGPILGSSGAAEQTVATPVSIGGEVKADGTESFLNVTGTLPASPSATVAGVNVAVTGAGSAAQRQRGEHITLAAGYTGAFETNGLRVDNLSAGTGTTLSYNTDGDSSLSNYGIVGRMRAATAGRNTGIFGAASNSTASNIGVIGFAKTDSATAENVGVQGTAYNITSPYSMIGGYFETAIDVSAPPALQAALVANNNALAASIFIGRDNNVTVFSINDGGGVNLMREVEANSTGVVGTPNVLAATESNSVMTNEGATALNVHLLPTAAKGLTFTFIVQDADGIRIAANTDDTIRIAGNVTAAAGYIESTTIGSSVTLVAINATEWVAVAALGTWVI